MGSVPDSGARSSYTYVQQNLPPMTQGTAGLNRRSTIEQEPIDQKAESVSKNIFQQAFSVASRGIRSATTSLGNALTYISNKISNSVSNFFHFITSSPQPKLNFTKFDEINKGLLEKIENQDSGRTAQEVNEVLLGAKLAKDLVLDIQEAVANHDVNKLTKLLNEKITVTSKGFDEFKECAKTFTANLKGFQEVSADPAKAFENLKPTDKATPLTLLNSSPGVFSHMYQSEGKGKEELFTYSMETKEFKEGPLDQAAAKAEKLMSYLPDETYSFSFAANSSQSQKLNINGTIPMNGKDTTIAECKTELNSIVSRLKSNPKEEDRELANNIFESIATESAGDNLWLGVMQDYRNKLLLQT